jgi:hypothetical protein
MNRVLPAVFGTLPDALYERLQAADRVILLANNPAITAADIEALAIGRQDVVVSFNTCMQWRLLSTAWTNVLVHGFNEPDKYFFGLPCSPQVQTMLDSSERGGFTLLMGCTGEITPMPGVGLIWANFPLPIITNYPVYRPSGKLFAGPTTGFSTLVLLDLLRREYAYNFQLLTLGFSNEAGDLWRGHAWDYERAWLHSAQVTAVALQPVSWWKRWLRGRRR